MVDPRDRRVYHAGCGTGRSPDLLRSCLHAAAKDGTGYQAGAACETAGAARMQDAIHAEVEQYADAHPTIPDDSAFYTARLPSPDASVLEWGGGTGRVLLPLAGSCGCIHGTDRSPALLACCLQTLQAAGLPPTKARADLGDITHLSLGRTFDLLIALYRVLQRVAMASQVAGVFRCVRAHLAPGGTGIVHGLHPDGGCERKRPAWGTTTEVCR